MFGIRPLPLALAALFTGSCHVSTAATIHEDFSKDPSTHGWRIFGNPQLFRWNAANHNLGVTWDSSQPNSYFYIPIDTVLTRNDDFAFEFDLSLSDIATGSMPGPFELGIGFLNLAAATNTAFQRAVYSPNLAEFDYYPAGYYTGYPEVPATTTPGFISRNGSAYAPTMLTPYELELPTNQTIHVLMSYTATNQTVSTALTTNGIPFATLPNLVLNNTNQSEFTAGDDFRVNAFSISSYSDAGQDPAYGGSILAHGTVGNCTITTPPPPVPNLTSSTNGHPGLFQLPAEIGWSFSLERTSDFQSWTTIVTATGNDGSSVQLSDSNPPPDHAFYRVRADRP
jgi:hypothetical protein